MPADRSQPQPTEDPVDLLVEAGFVDVDFVSAQLGKRFDSPEEAAQAVLDGGDVSPHPLVEFSWLPRRKSWQRSGLHPISWYLGERRRRNRLPTHPLVDTRLIWSTYPEARFHDFGVLAYWLESATPDTPLPTNLLPEPVSWGTYRAAAIAAARSWREESIRRRPPLVHPAPPTTPVLGDVTVVLCVQDSAPLLRPTITALQAQTFTAWKLVAVDAGSRDDSAAVLRGLAAFDERIKVLEQPRRTPGAGLNAALAHAHGDHLVFLSPGRSWPPEHLARIVDHAQRTGSVLVQAGPGPVARSRDELVAGRSADLTTALVRRDAVMAVGGFDETLGGAVERDLVLRLTREHPVEAVDLPVDRRPDTVGSSQADDWDSLVLERHLVDWESVAAAPRVDSLVSYVVPLGSETRRTVEWLTAPSLVGAERIAIGMHLRRMHHVLAGSLAAVVPDARFVSVHAEVNLNVTLNLGISHARGATVVLTRPETMPPRQPISASLSAALSEPDVAVVQPLVVSLDGTILSAGAFFRPGNDHPGLLLAGHPAEDARRVGQRTIAAPASPLVALPTAVAAAMHGLNCRFRSVLAETELGLRAHAAGHGRSVVLPDAVVTSRTDYAAPDDLIGGLASLRHEHLEPPRDDTAALLRLAGFEITDHRNQRVTTAPGAAEAVLVPQPVVRAIDGIDESPPRLRWALDIAAPAAARGDRWGDTHFARSLSHALERRGQHVAVDRRDARDRDTRDHDDVLLVLRGLDRVEPRPGLLNMEWIISHPDMVTPEEVAGFDAVYAASLSWSARVSRDWGVSIEPLLQCTDARWFHPGRGEPGTGPEVVFVGNSRGVYRFAVRTALAVGAPLTLHGNDWAEFVPAEMIASTGLANEDVGALYASAGVVLNDHHLDMRRDSFASNRLFDAAACGARIVSDPIDGLEETFSGLVQTFRDEAELRDLVFAPYRAFPDDDTRRAIAQRIVAEHSFDHRAETLIGDAVRRLRARGR